MAEIIAAKITLDSSEAEKSVGSFKSQLRSAKEELIAISEKFGENSVQARKAAQAVAELQDAIGDAAEVAALFDPSKKFAALSNVVSSVAGGFSALTGVMALVGEESNETEKVIAKLQATMAITQGLNNIGQIKEEFFRLFSVIKTLGTGGIGLLIGAIAGLVSYFVNLSKATKTATEDTREFQDELSAANKTVFEMQTKMDVLKERIRSAGKSFTEKQAILKNYNKEFGETLGVAKSVNEAEQKLIQNGPAYITILGLKAKAQAANNLAAKESEKALKDLLAAEDKIAEASKFNTGADGKDKYGYGAATEKALNEEKLQAQKEYNDKIGKLNTIAADAETQAAEVAKKFRINIEGDKTDVVKKESEKRIKIVKDEGESIAAILNEQQRAGITLRQKNFEKLLDANEKEKEAKKAAAEKEQQRLIDDGNKGVEALDLTNVKRLTGIQAVLDSANQLGRSSATQKLADLENEHQAELAAVEGNAAAVAIIEEKYARLKMDLERNIFSERLGIIQNFLGTAAGMFQKQTVAYKVLAIAEAVIGTYRGVADALAARTSTVFEIVLKIANVATIIGAGIANVAKIASVQVPGGGGGGAPSISAPLIPQAVRTQTSLDAVSISGVGNAANQSVRAYTLSYDNAGVLEREARLNRASRLGG